MAAEKENFLSRNERVYFKGFSKEEETFLSQLIATIGFPVDRLAIILKADGKNKEVLAGAVPKIFEHGINIICIRRIFFTLSLEEQKRTLVHELLHVYSPRFSDLSSFPYVLFRKNKSLEVKKTWKIAKRIARQSLKTGIYLDFYHADLARRYRLGLLNRSLGTSAAAIKSPASALLAYVLLTKFSITFKKFAEETYAILGAMRFMDEQKLQEIENLQRAAWKKKGKQTKTFTALLSSSTPDSGGHVVPEGIDQWLMELTGASDVPALQKRIGQLVTLDVAAPSAEQGKKIPVEDIHGLMPRGLSHILAHLGISKRPMTRPI